MIPARGIIDLEGNLGIGKVGIFGNERSNWHNDEDGRKISYIIQICYLYLRLIICSCKTLKIYK